MDAARSRFTLFVIYLTSGHQSKDGVGVGHDPYEAEVRQILSLMPDKKRKREMMTSPQPL